MRSATRTMPSANTASVDAEPIFCSTAVAQLHARRVDARRRAVAAPLAAGARRDRVRRVAEAHRHLVERHAHRLGGGLRDDRVRAGADVGHVGLDSDRAAVVEPHARARLRHDVVAERRRDAHADQPAAVAHLCGLRDCAGSSRSARRRCAGIRRGAAARTDGRAFRGPSGCRCGSGIRPGRGRAARPSRPSRSRAPSSPAPRPARASRCLRAGRARPGASS